MVARLTTPSSVVVLATAQPQASRRAAAAAAARPNSNRNAKTMATANPASAAAAAAAPTTTAPHTAATPRPDAAGRFGAFGGKYVPETLIAALAELEQEYAKAQADPEFKVRFYFIFTKNPTTTSSASRVAKNEKRKKNSS